MAGFSNRRRRSEARTIETGRRHRLDNAADHLVRVALALLGFLLHGDVEHAPDHLRAVIAGPQNAKFVTEPHVTAVGMSETVLMAKRAVGFQPGDRVAVSVPVFGVDKTKPEIGVGYEVSGLVAGDRLHVWADEADRRLSLDRGDVEHDRGLRDNELQQRLLPVVRPGLCRFIAVALGHRIEPFPPVCKLTL